MQTRKKSPPTRPRKITQDVREFKTPDTKTETAAETSLKKVNSRSLIIVSLRNRTAGRRGRQNVCV